MIEKYFISAIGTDSGKTLVSAVFCEALGADYWKPVQAGYPRDTETVQGLVSRTGIRFHPERYLLNTPMSPHGAATIDQVEIHLDDFELPAGDQSLIVEGAGGLLVPLHEDLLLIDLIKKLGLELILVSNIYLGSINHTLLSAESLKRRGIPVKGIIFNGESNESTESVILHQTGFRLLLKIPKYETINKQVVSSLAKQLKNNLDEISRKG